MLPRLSKCFQTTSKLPLTRRRHYSAPSQSPRVLGEWKGLGAPAWSVEEKLLGKSSSIRTGHKVTPEDLRRISKLSYLSPPEDKIDKLTEDLDQILWSVASMEEVDTKQVAPLLSILEDFSLKTRPDVHRPTTPEAADGKIQVSQSTISQDTQVEWGYEEQPEPVVLENASMKELGFFVVPKQKQPWEEDNQGQPEEDDVLPLRAVQKTLHNSSEKL